MNYLVSLLSALLGAGILSFIQFLIMRNDNKNDRISKVEEQLEAINKKLETSEKDQIRTQMLLMISDYPNENAEIMKLGQHYFGRLKGDWYMTNLFNSWLLRQNLGKPEWFNEHG